MNRLTQHRFEKGQSLLELALVLVFLLILLAGAVDLGRMMYEYLSMRDAAQEGAGYGAVFPNDCAHIVDRVNQNLPDDNYSSDYYRVHVNVDGMDCAAASSVDYASSDPPLHGCAGKPLTIIIEHESEITMPLISAFTGSTVPMRVVIEDRIVRPACR